MYKNKKRLLDLTIREVLQLLWKNKVLVFIAIFVLLFVLLSLFSSTFRAYFLFDRYGKFQWVGVSAIVAAIGLYLNSILKREEIMANILTKNDLDLLKDFRENISKFSALVWKYNNVLNDVFQSNDLEKIFEEGFQSKDTESEKDDYKKYVQLKSNELNSLYFQLMELYPKIYFDLTISFADEAKLVNNSLDKTQKLLNEALKMFETKHNSNDVQLIYNKIVHENNNLIYLARNYIVLVMENKVSSFDSNILDDN